MPFPVEEKFIEKAESELGIKFPQPFRQKMMTDNGGEVAVGTDAFVLHPFFDTSDKKRLKRTCNSIVHETKHARTHYGVPSNLILIGSNGGGDTLVYRIDEEGILDERIFWLDHENGDLILAAADFADLKLIG